MLDRTRSLRRATPFLLALTLPACSGEGETTPCESLWSGICQRAAECNATGSSVAVYRPTPSGEGHVGLEYGDEADCRGGASYCKEDGPIEECRTALAGASCAPAEDDFPSGLTLPNECIGID